MPEWLNSLSDQDLTTWFMTAGTVMAGVVAVWRGYVSGQPTSAAVANAVASANCRVMDLAPALHANAKELSELRKDIDDIHTLLIRIEDRTRQH